MLKWKLWSSLERIWKVLMIFFYFFFKRNFHLQHRNTRCRLFNYALLDHIFLNIFGIKWVIPKFIFWILLQIIIENKIAIEISHISIHCACPMNRFTGYLTNNFCKSTCYVYILFLSEYFHVVDLQFQKYISL